MKYNNIEEQEIAIEKSENKFDNIEKALEKHFSLHDVIEMMNLINAYRDYEHKLIRYYDENDFDKFLKQYKENKCI